MNLIMLLLFAIVAAGCVNIAVIGADNEVTVQTQGAGQVEDRRSERRTGSKDWQK